MLKERIDKNFHYIPLIIQIICLHTVFSYPLQLSIEILSRGIEPTPFVFYPFILLIVGTINIFLYYKRDDQFLVMSFIYYVLHVLLTITFFIRYAEIMNNFATNSFAIREGSKAVMYSVFMVLFLLKSKKVKQYFGKVSFEKVEQLNMKEMLQGKSESKNNPQLVGTLKVKNAPNSLKKASRDSFVADELVKLNDLKERGVLSEKEFEQQKKKLLA